MSKRLLQILNLKTYFHTDEGIARAVDEFGEVHHAHRVLEIRGSSAVPADPARYPD